MQCECPQGGPGSVRGYGECRVLESPLVRSLREAWRRQPHTGRHLGDPGRQAALQFGLELQPQA